MKNKYFFSVFVLLILFVSANSYAQSSGNEQRLVGNWQNVYTNSSLVFNSNGTGTGTWWGSNFNYGAAGNKMVIVTNNKERLFEYNISTDGRTLILHDLENGGGSLFRRI
jgi:hypothetical protein